MSIIILDDEKENERFKKMMENLDLEKDDELLDFKKGALHSKFTTAPETKKNLGIFGHNLNALNQTFRFL